MRVDIGNGLWFDSEEERKQREFMKQKERELWEWIFSGQRTIDLFGREGAKIVLERQHRLEMRMVYRHKSRGRL